jgi:hypothetical protein
MAKERRVGGYLEPGRLPDVIAALQVMAAGPRPYKTIVDWADELSRPRNEDSTPAQTETDRWAAVFKEHPEFFLVYRRKREPDIDKAALRLRYIKKDYDPYTQKEYTPEEAGQLAKDVRDKLTTKPLEADQISALVDTAIELHKRALEETAARRWWIPVLTAILGFVGAGLGTVVAALLGLHKPALWG